MEVAEVAEELALAPEQWVRCQQTIVSGWIAVHFAFESFDEFDRVILVLYSVFVVRLVLETHADRYIVSVLVRSPITP